MSLYSTTMQYVPHLLRLSGSYSRIFMHNCPNEMVVATSATESLFMSKRPAFKYLFGIFVNIFISNTSTGQFKQQIYSPLKAQTQSWSTKMLRCSNTVHKEKYIQYSQQSIKNTHKESNLRNSRSLVTENT